MQKIIIVAATEGEIAPFRKWNESLSPTTKSMYQYEYCITGVGMVSTTFALTKCILNLQSGHQKIAGILNVGIAGSFDKRIPIGQLVEIQRDQFSELGAEDDQIFVSSESLGLGQSMFHYSDFLSQSNLGPLKLPIYQAITVNTVHGNELSIQKTLDRFQPQVESMEGAAVFFVAEQFNLGVHQVRSISNYVEKRNRDLWNIPLAISNLNNWLHEYFYKQNSL